MMKLISLRSSMAHLNNNDCSSTAHEPSALKNFSMSFSTVSSTGEQRLSLHSCERDSLYSPGRRIMTRNDSAREASSARIAYEARPWLKHYPSYMQTEITPRFASGLEMFLETVKNTPEQWAIYYFEQSMSYSQLDRASTALAAALKEQGIV